MPTTVAIERARLRPMPRMTSFQRLGRPRSGGRTRSARLSLPVETVVPRIASAGVMRDARSAGTSAASSPTTSAKTRPMKGVSG